MVPRRPGAGSRPADLRPARSADEGSAPERGDGGPGGRGLRRARRPGDGPAAAAALLRPRAAAREGLRAEVQDLGGAWSCDDPQVQALATSARCRSCPSSTRSAIEVCPRSPRTCAQPVIPDLRDGGPRSGNVAVNSSTNSGRSGRGPIRLISPRSDVDELRQLVERCGAGSVRRACGGPRPRCRRGRPRAVGWRQARRRWSAARIVRNFRRSKTRPSRPTRRWRKSTGPGDSSSHARCDAPSRGARATSATGERAVDECA